MTMESINEKDLIAAAAQGSQRAYQELIRIHSDAVYRFAYAMAGAETAQTLTENAFLTAWRQLEFLPQMNLTLRWRLYQLICQDCADHSLHARRHRSVLPPAGDEKSQNFTFQSRRYEPRNAMEQLALRADVDEALHLLPVAFRQALLLHMLCGLTDTEIAVITQQSAEDIHDKILRTRSFLRRRILLGGGFFPLDENDPVSESLRACPEQLRTLDAAADGLCTEEERKILNEHLSSCPGCTEYLESLSVINRTIANHKQDLPDNMSGNILYQIQRDMGLHGASNIGGHEKSIRTPRRFAFGRFSIIALCIALVLLAYSGGILHPPAVSAPIENTPPASSQTPVTPAPQDDVPPQPTEPIEDNSEETPNENSADPNPDPLAPQPDTPGAPSAEEPLPTDETVPPEPDPDSPSISGGSGGTSESLIPAGEIYAAVYTLSDGAAELSSYCTASFRSQLADGTALVYYLVPVSRESDALSALDDAQVAYASYDGGASIHPDASNLLFILSESSF